MLREKDEMEKENEELKKRIKRLSSVIQVEVIFKNMFLHRCAGFEGKTKYFGRH